MKCYKASDGISAGVKKSIRKHVKGKEGDLLINKFIKAADKGIVGKEAQTGIKKLSGNNGLYTHEIKILGNQAKWRIYGYRKSTGEWVFDKLVDHSK